MKKNSYISPLAFLHNLLLAYIVYMLCRVAHVCENWALFSADWGDLSLWKLLCGSLMFDTAALGYTMMPYALIMLLPLTCRNTNAYQTAAKWVYIVTNSLAVAVNLADSVYSQFTGRRTTSTFFLEFQNDGNLGDIVATELLSHWYLVLVGIGLIAMMWLLYWKPKKMTRPAKSWQFYIINSLILIVYVPLCICGIRGGTSKGTQPTGIIHANQFVQKPIQASIVLNTPFTVIRTVGKQSFPNPEYMAQSRLDSIYSPIHQSTATERKNCNVVVLILEGMGSEYYGALNEYPGYTPFLDSLMANSLTFANAFANGRKSVEGLPSVLSSIPSFVEPIFLTNYSMNDMTSIAGELGKNGYATAFFHGAINSSMGIQGYTRSVGFQQYFGRTEYEADKLHGSKDDFDGTWAIWDEPFLQFAAHHICQMQQPFAAAIFTATSHHPFVVPEKYAKTLHADGHPMHTCVRYTDHSLRQFFNTAKQQPWYNNTIFIITADHVGPNTHESYANDLGRYRVPIIFYDPSGAMPRKMVSTTAQQIDIMPTLLNYLGHDKPYIAFGKDLLGNDVNTDTKPWAINYLEGVYQYVDGSYLLQFDGTNTVAIYNEATDHQLKNNLKEQPRLQATKDSLELRAKAVIQSYMHRMINDQLTIK